METQAKLNNARISAQKCRLVTDQIRNLPIVKALAILNFSNKSAAKLVKKVLESAIANAEYNNGMDIDDLKISKIYVNQGPSYKRILPRAKGRSSKILKPTCHIVIKVSNYEGN